MLAVISGRIGFAQRLEECEVVGSRLELLIAQHTKFNIMVVVASAPDFSSSMPMASLPIAFSSRKLICLNQKKQVVFALSRHSGCRHANALTKDLSTEGTAGRGLI
jgi:hypothetical protein